MTPLFTDSQPTPEPHFPWFSKGVLFLFIVACWSVWIFAKQPAVPVNDVLIEPGELAAWMGLLILIGSGWQWLRYRDFKKKVSRGTWGQPSGWSRLFAPRPTHTGSRGGQYTVNHKGNKIYKKRR
jgi:hypothetical protein